MLRVFIHSDSESAISSLSSVSNATKKKDFKRVYFENQRENNFLPPQSSSSIPTTLAPAAATHVAEAFRQWAMRFELPPGEANVLMSWPFLGTLSKIVSVDGNILQSIPIEDRSKQLLQVFFGGDACNTSAMPNTTSNCVHYTTSQHTFPTLSATMPNWTLHYASRRRIHSKRFERLLLHRNFWFSKIQRRTSAGFALLLRTCTHCCTALLTWGTSVVVGMYWQQVVQ